MFYEGLNLANQKRRQLGVFGRKLGGSHSPFYCYLIYIKDIKNKYVQIVSYILI